MSNEAFIEVDPEKFNDRCPNCGGKKFVDVHISWGSHVYNKQPHGLKCLDCGKILIPINK